MEFRQSGSTRPAQRSAAQPSARGGESEPSSAKKPATYRPAPHAPKNEKRSRKQLLLRVVVAGLVVLGVCAGLWWMSTKNSSTAIDNSKYQAVFLENGQVYFGKLHPFTDTSMRMTDVYYLQAKEDASVDSENPQQTTSSQKNVELIKLGDEIHGPEDEMVILLDQIVFYENLKTDSKVVESIGQHKKTQN